MGISNPSLLLLQMALLSPRYLAQARSLAIHIYVSASPLLRVAYLNP